MELAEAEKNRRRVYAPKGMPAPKQNKITQIATQLESCQRKELTEQRKISGYRDSIAAWLGNPKPESKQLQDTSETDSSDILEVYMKPVKVPAVAKKFEKQNDEEMYGEQAKVSRFPHKLSRAAPSISQAGHYERVVSQAKTLHKNISESSLDLHETTQFPLEAANIPDTNSDPVTRSTYTMFASPPEIPRITIPEPSLIKTPTPSSNPSPDPNATPQPPKQPKHQPNTLQIPTIKPKSSTLSLREAVQWGPSGPPPDCGLPILPPDVVVAARKAKEQERVWNRAIRAREKRVAGHWGLVREATEFDLRFLSGRGGGDWV